MSWRLPPVTRLTRSASRKVGQRGPFAIQNFPIGQNRHTAAAPHEDDCSRKPGPSRASQSKATTEMASDSSNSVSVGLGQLVVEGRGIGRHRRVHAARKNRAFGVEDQRLDGGGCPLQQRRVVSLLDRRRGALQSDARATPEVERPRPRIAADRAVSAVSSLDRAVLLRDPVVRLACSEDPGQGLARRAVGGQQRL